MSARSKSIARRKKAASSATRPQSATPEENEKSPVSSTDDLPRGKFPFAWLGALALLSAALYWPVRNGEFIWDDISIYIVENRLLPLADGLFRFWFTSEPGDYYPLTYTMFWFEWR